MNYKKNANNTDNTRNANNAKVYIAKMTYRSFGRYRRSSEEEREGF